jgi:hypothetical protein
VHKLDRVLLTVTALVLGACASASAAEVQDMRRQLRTAMQTQVADRDQRDAQSRLMADLVGKDAVRGMSRPEVRAAFGPGIACSLEVCRKNSFLETDWYYEIGVRADPKLDQLPLLLFGFDPHERVVRTFTLTTH